MPESAALGVDLGTGGGVPGLVLAAERPSTTWVLLDADADRVAFLDDAALQLGLANVRTIHARAEDYGRSAARETFDVVTARGFGAPAVTAECAAPLLRVGGVAVVSDPPEGGAQRWPAVPLAELGQAVVDHVALGSGHFTRLQQARSCPDRFPRRPGVPARRPLF